MIDKYEKNGNACTITYIDDTMVIEYSTGIKITCSIDEKIEYNAVYFWNRVE